MIADDTYLIDGLRTRVRVSGEGPPLLLIGGVWTQVPLWDDVQPHLTGFRTIAFDYHDGLRYPHLERIPGTPDRLGDILAPRRR